LEQLTKKNMSHYNGLSVARSGKSWSALKEIYSTRKASELDLKITKGIERVASRIGLELDESVYCLSLRGLAKYFEMKYDFMILLIFNRWSPKLAESAGDLFIIGTGECEECGADSLEFHDHGAYWKTPDIYKCKNCGIEQFKRGD